MPRKKEKENIQPHRYCIPQGWLFKHLSTKQRYVSTLQYNLN